MFESVLKLNPKEFKKRHIMSLDISTSAISAMLAVRHENSGIIDIFKTLKNPLNLMGENFSGLRTAHVIRDGILKIFKDAHEATRHFDEITVVLADPFFSDVNFSKKANRRNQKVKISRQETETILKTLENEAGTTETTAQKPDVKPAETAAAQSSLVRAGDEMLFMKVNGYEVDDAVGYGGKSIEISAVFTFINQFLHETVLSAHDKFFPRASVKFISDARLIRNALKKFNYLGDPAVLFNVDGEATGVYLLSDKTAEHLGTSTFGTKTLERRVPSISQYAQNMLEAGLKAKTESAVETALLDWWEEISQHLKNSETAGLPKKCFVSGRDAAIAVFPQHIAGYMKALSGVMPDLAFFSVAGAKALIHPQSAVSQNQDILLASLLV